MANKKDYSISSSNDMFYELSGIGNSTGIFDVGYSNTFGAIYRGALRFQSLAISQGATITSATLNIRVGVRDGTDPVKVKVWGIDEDDTGDFTSYPMGRTKTTASNTHHYDSSGTGWFGISVTSIVQEIINRASWSSGNDLGFIIDDDGTDTGDDNDLFSVFIGTLGNDSILTIQLSATPTFFPTPGTVSAPTFPTTSNYGIKISAPGYDIGTASESNLLFSTRKKVFKVLNEGTLDISSGSASYTHNLGYNPATLGFIKGTASGETRMYKLNKVFNPYSDPDVGGYILSGTATNKVINFGGGTTSFCYLYTFIDPLN